MRVMFTMTFELVWKDLVLFSPKYPSGTEQIAKRKIMHSCPYVSIFLCWAVIYSMYYGMQSSVMEIIRLV